LAGAGVKAFDAVSPRERAMISLSGREAPRKIEKIPIIFVTAIATVFASADPTASAAALTKKTGNAYSLAPPFFCDRTEIFSETGT
jgi:hypothetical protein